MITILRKKVADMNGRARARGHRPSLLRTERHLLAAGAEYSVDPFHLGRRRPQRCIDRCHLVGVDAELAGKAEAFASLGVELQLFRVLEVDRDAVDRAWEAGS